MNQIIINPGSGPVEGENTEKNAIENIKHYITDCGLKDVTFLRIKNKDKDGRYHFLLFRDDWDRSVCHHIDMPGLSLHKVRYMHEEDQNIWDFPRLYIDGSSWVWCYAMLADKDFDISEEE